MSDVARLLAWFDSGALVRPDAARPNTVALARAIASRCGAADIALSAPASRIAETIGAAGHIILVLADGLGMNLIERLPGDSFFRRHMVMEMQAVFPSSTAPAITSLATGCWPAEHAVPGWFVYLPDDEIIATILPFIERFSKRPLAEVGIDPERALPVPSLLPRFAHEAICYMPSHITGSVYSDYLSGGPPQVPYKRLSAATDAIATRVFETPRPTYTYLYVPFIDAAEHKHGPYTKPVAKTVARVEQAIESLAEKVAGRARVIVTADHGLTRVDRRHQTELKDGDPLLDLLRLPPTGEPRVPLFFTRDGALEDFADAFRERFGATHALLTIDEVDELRLLGPEPLAAETRRRLGDFMAISATADAISYKPDEPMLGYHGGLLPGEMRVPLIVI